MTEETTAPEAAEVRLRFTGLGGVSLSWIQDGVHRRGYVDAEHPTVTVPAGVVVTLLGRGDFVTDRPPPAEPEPAQPAEPEPAPARRKTARN
jgi:hypothetical protein